jgi:hypothetical protein
MDREWGLFWRLLGYFLFFFVVFIAFDKFREYTHWPHRTVHAQQMSAPELPSVYDCNSTTSWSQQICRAYDPATKKHFIVVTDADNIAIAPDDY